MEDERIVHMGGFVEVQRVWFVLMHSTILVESCAQCFVMLQLYRRLFFLVKGGMRQGRAGGRGGRHRNRHQGLAREGGVAEFRKHGIWCRVLSAVCARARRSKSCQKIKKDGWSALVCAARRRGCVTSAVVRGSATVGELVAQASGRLVGKAQRLSVARVARASWS